MERIFILMSIIGIFSFICFGLCGANSMEAHKSEKFANVLSILCFVGFFVAVIGFIGLIILGIKIK